MRVILFFIGIAVITWTSCTADSEATEDSSAATTTESQPAATGGNTADELPWTFLVAGILHNNATIQAGKSPKVNENAGHWIDFKENGTFEYGVYEEKSYSGTWHYDGETDMLELTPDNNAAKQSEWTIKHQANNLIWIGTPTYGDNSIQMQWLRREGYPSKE